MASLERAPRGLPPSQRRTVSFQSHENPSGPGSARHRVPMHDRGTVMQNLIRNKKMFIKLFGLPTTTTGRDEVLSIYKHFLDHPPLFVERKKIMTFLIINYDLSVTGVKMSR